MTVIYGKDQLISRTLVILMKLSRNHLEKRLGLAVSFFYDFALILCYGARAYKKKKKE